MQSVLQAVAVLTKQVMPGHPESSVSLLTNDRPITAVFTGKLARDCDEDSRSIAERFASYAGVAAANMYAYEDARDMADHLQQALESRAVIDQAKGILMERHKLTADRAFHALAQVSMRDNTKLRDVADRLVRTGELPQR